MKIQFGRRFWIVATAVIVVFTVFVVGRNALHAVKIKRQINALTREQSYYSEKIAQDSTLLERLKYDDYLAENRAFRFHRASLRVLPCSANGTYFNNRPANGGGCKPPPFALIVLEAVPVQRFGFSVAEPHEARSGSDAADGMERRAEADAEISGEAFGGLRRGGEQEFVVLA